MGPACADPAARVGRHPQAYGGRVSWTSDRRPRTRCRRLPRRLGAAAPGPCAGRGGRPAAHRPAARAPAGLHRRQAHRRPTSAPPTPAARRSSTSTAAARSPSTGRASWSATRSSALPDHVKVVDYVRRVEEALIGVCRDLGVETARVPGPQRRLAAGRRPRPRAQGRRDRHPGQPGGGHARLRPQLRRRPRLVRPVRAVRHRRRRRHLADRRARSPGHGLRRAAPRRATPARPAGVGAVRPDARLRAPARAATPATPAHPSSLSAR